MKNLTRIVAVAVVAAAGLAHLPADAATPESGKITKAKRSVKWTGGPFTLSQPNDLNSCLGGADDPICDHYMLVVNLGDRARVQVAITTASPNETGGVQPVQGDDYDLEVYAPDGTLVAESLSERGYEKLTFNHRSRFKGKPYEVRVAPYAVRPGSTYKGTAKALTLGR